MTTSKLTPSRRDWFKWTNPPMEWCQQYAETPGIQWAGNGQYITHAVLHRSHLPLIGACTNADIGLIQLAGGGLGVKGEPPVHFQQNEVLRPYQQEALNFMCERRGTLLALEQRLGKTVTACYAHNPADGILVVVGPLAARDVWKHWIERVTGFPPLNLQRRTNIEIQPGYPAYFVHYDVLEAHMELFTRERIGTLVLDEVHLCQGRKTKRTQAASVLALRASRVIGLSGTPMWGRPDSLYSILHMITPGAWGAHFPFAVRYCNAEPGAHGWTYDGISNEEELRVRLKEIVFRRTWRDIVGDLPLETVVVEPVATTAAQTQAIEAAAVEAALARGTNTTAGYLSILRLKLATVKITAAVQTATHAILDGHKVVIWYWHNEIADAITKHLLKGEGLEIGHFPVFHLSSAYDQRVRDEQVAKFREASGPAVMIAGIAVGGVAIDLSCSDYAIFAELDWTPANILQAKMRTFHPSRPHVLVYLIADVSIEQKLIDALGVREDFGSRIGLGASEVAKMVLEKSI